MPDSKSLLFSKIAAEYLVGSFSPRDLLQNPLCTRDLVSDILTTYQGSSVTEEEMFRWISSSPHLDQEDLAALPDAPWDFPFLNANPKIDPSWLITAGLPVSPSHLSRNSSLRPGVLLRERKIGWDPVIVSANEGMEISDVAAVARILGWDISSVKSGLIQRGDILRYEPYLCKPSCYSNLTEDMISKGWDISLPGSRKIRRFDPFSFEGKYISRYSPVSYEFILDTKGYVEWDPKGLLLNPHVGCLPEMRRMREEYPEIASRCRGITRSILLDHGTEIGWDFLSLAKEMDLTGFTRQEIMEIFGTDLIPDLLGNDSFPLHLVPPLVEDDPALLLVSSFASNNFSRYRIGKVPTLRIRRDEPSPPQFEMDI